MISFPIDIKEMMSKNYIWFWDDRYKSLSNLRHALNYKAKWVIR